MNEDDEAVFDAIAPGLYALCPAWSDLAGIPALQPHDGALRQLVVQVYKLAIEDQRK